MEIKNIEKNIYFIFLNRLFALTAIYSITALTLSFFAEYAWKIEPCYLCKLQRIPYLAILPISFFGLFFTFKTASRNLIISFFFISLALSGFHLMIQTGIVKDTCAVPQLNSMIDFEKLVFNTPKKSCAEISFRLFGLPVSLYNLTSALLFIFAYFKSKN